MTQHVALGLDVGVIVPPDAQLRLTIQKDRKIRIPFSVKDVPIPKIEKDIDIPASADRAFVEAIAIAPGDPILSGIKFRAEANCGARSGAYQAAGPAGEPPASSVRSWDSSSGEHQFSWEPGDSPYGFKPYKVRFPEVELELQGTPAELASSYGEIDLTSVLDEEGNPLDLFPEMAGPVPGARR